MNKAQKKKYIVIAAVVVAALIGVAFLIDGVKNHNEQVEREKQEQAQKEREQREEEERKSRENLTPEQAAQKVQDIIKEKNSGSDQYCNDTVKQELQTALEMYIKEVKTPTDVLAAGEGYVHYEPPQEDVLITIKDVSNEEKNIDLKLEIGGQSIRGIPGFNDNAGYHSNPYLYRYQWQFVGECGYKHTKHTIRVAYPDTKDLS